MSVRNSVVDPYTVQILKLPSTMLIFLLSCISAILVGGEKYMVLRTVEDDDASVQIFG